MPSAGTRATLFKKRLDPLVAALHGIEARDAEALHQARVASRRLREIVPVLELPPDAVGAVARRLQRVTQRLGKLRELDVLQPLVNDLRETVPRSIHALDHMAAAIAEEIHQTRGWLTRKLPPAKLERLSRLLDGISRQLDEPHIVRGRVHDVKTWVWAIDARVVRRAARLSAAIDEAGALYDAARLHGVRIALKKFRYAAELSVEAHGSDRAQELAALKQAQGILGRLQDFEILRERVQRASHETPGAEGVDPREFDALTSVIARECRHLHAAFMRDRAELRRIATQFADGAGRRPPVGQRQAG